MPKVRNALESAFEHTLFASRWLLAPLYLGMVLALVAILVVFARELYEAIPHVFSLNAESVILLALSLIDLSLTGNLLLIVIFAGYENFVSRIDLTRDKDRPHWMGTVDFSDLKIKLIASIVAISAIALLRAFLPLGDAGAQVNVPRLRWMVIIHITFILSGVMLALMDWVTGQAEQLHGKHHNSGPQSAITDHVAARTAGLPLPASHPHHR